jgi:hypothetical protein
MLGPGYGNNISDATIAKLKAKLPKEQAKKLPDSFLDFFTYYQDDSWIFSDTPEEHLLYIRWFCKHTSCLTSESALRKAPLFQTASKLEWLGVAELFLDKVKAKSILDWEKPDSLFTLQSRLCALN